jgi:hypothetical protein
MTTPTRHAKWNCFIACASDDAESNVPRHVVAETWCRESEVRNIAPRHEANTFASVTE